ncbi:MAG: hypothetical protein IPI65_17495 [Bacteroidetes bacterium]|nr:hypothetical protein [Bacteroidota bacterium]
MRLGVLIQTLDIYFPVPTLIDPQLLALHECLSRFIVQEAIYETTVNLPPKAGGYDLFTSAVAEIQLLSIL